jgi:hypothetical protein
MGTIETVLAAQNEAKGRCLVVGRPMRAARSSPDRADRASRNEPPAVLGGLDLVTDVPRRLGIEICLGYRPRCRSGWEYGASATSFDSRSEPNLANVPLADLANEIGLACR